MVPFKAQSHVVFLALIGADRSVENVGWLML